MINGNADLINAVAAFINSLSRAQPVQRIAVVVMGSMPAIEPPLHCLLARLIPEAVLSVYGLFEPWMAVGLPENVTMKPCDPALLLDTQICEVDLVHLHASAKVTDESIRQAVAHWQKGLPAGAVLTVSHGTGGRLGFTVGEIATELDLAWTSPVSGFGIWRKPSSSLSNAPASTRKPFGPLEHTEFGVVVGTFAAVPYVHLQLESWRRNFPAASMLIHDDASPRHAELRSLASLYGAEFVTTGTRQRHFTGDVSAFCHGLMWARSRRLSMLVKLSRRFLPVTDWIPGLRTLALESQYPTYSGACDAVGFGFLTECVGVRVDAWLAVAIDRLTEEVRRDTGKLFVEGFVHELARRVFKENMCPEAMEYDRLHPRPPGCDSYCAWPLLEGGRARRNEYRLWHDCNEPGDYLNLSMQWGLPYTLEDFVDPNQGFGQG